MTTRAEQLEHPANFEEDGQLYLVRCVGCPAGVAPDGARENYLPAVAAGYCAWCGWGLLRLVRPENDEVGQ